MKNFRILLVVLGIFLGTHFSLNADKLNVRVDQIISNKFPKMEIYVSVVDNEDDPILSLVPGNFTVLVDGIPVKSKLKVEGFQYTEEPIAYSLILSANGMMDGGPIDKQQKAAISILESLREQDRLSFYTFGEEVKTLFEFEENNENLLEKISDVDLLGYNPHLYDVLIFTARRLNESGIKRKAIIIMTDGREVGSKYNQDQLYSVIDELNIPVYSVGIRLMAGQNLHRIIAISEHTGGGYIYANDLNRIPKSMEKIGDQIRMGYSIKFKASGLKGDDQYHQVEVRVNHRKGESTFFKNFIATRIPFPLWAKIVLLIIVLLLIAGMVILVLITRKNMRKTMGISTRKCPDCNQIMKDDWDECIFCKYMPKKKSEKTERYK